MSPATVSLRNVCKRFGKTVAVHDINLEVPEGSLTGFIGPNGAGKSTTIRMIMSIIHPDEGSVTVLGTNALEAKNRIGYLPEERGLYRRMKVTEFLKFMATLKGLPSAGLSAKVRYWLERLQIEEAGNKRCQELSKGQQQKIQFIACIINDPQLIILDEPFSGLDPVNARLLNTLISELHDQGKTIIFSTHVMHQAEQLCDRIVLINRGEKILDASLTEIHQQFDPRTVQVEPVAITRETSSLLSSIPGVEQVDWSADGRSAELTVMRTLDPQSVMQLAIARIPLRAVQLRRPTLDDVFVQLVGEAVPSSKESGNG